MTTLQELMPQLAVVVDLAVEDNDDRRILVEDRLIACLEIDHAQTLDSEADSLVDMDASRVGSAMLHGRAHLSDQTAINLASLRSFDDYSAHGSLTPKAVRRGN